MFTSMIDAGLMVNELFSPHRCLHHREIRGDRCAWLCMVVHGFVHDFVHDFRH
jgi:hypothetical protein